MEEQKNCCQYNDKCQCAKQVIMALVGVVLIVYLGALARNAVKNYDYIGQSPDYKNIITVDGSGKTTAVPDVALINIGVISDSDTVVKAQKDNTDKMNKIIDALKKNFKIDSKDIQTGNYSVNPKYDWNSGTQRIIGYSINQNVSVKVRNFDNIGDILGQATALGANSVSGPTFTIDDLEKYKKEARAEAIKEAKDKAEVLAKQVGVKLGRIVNFSEGTTADYLVPMMAGLGGGNEMLAKSAPAPIIEAGSNEINITVSISYELK